MMRPTAANMQAIRQHTTNIHALIIRDMMVRFGRDNLGFLWTILEPMILCSGVLVIWSNIHSATVHGVPVIGFVLTGYMPLTLWRHMTNSIMRIISNNSGLLYHARLSHFDLIFARLILEFISTTAALTVIYGVLLAVGLAEPVQDWGLLLAAWIFTGWLHAGLGLLLSTAVELYEWVDRFIQPLQYLMLPLSGVFFTVDWLPSYAQRLSVWNPAVNCFEMFRAGYFGESVTTHYHVAYIAAWSFALSMSGLVAVQKSRAKLNV